MVLMLQYLIFTQFLRMTLVLLPLLFGVIALPSAVIIFSGLFVDLIYIFVLAFHRYPKEDLKTPPKDRKYFESPFKKRPDWLCASILTGIFITVLGAILRTSGVAAAGAGYELFVFISLTLTQTIVLLFFLQSGTPTMGVPTARMTVLAAFGIVCGMTVLISCFPHLSALFGCEGISISIVLFSLLAIPFFAGSLVLSGVLLPRIIASAKKFLAQRLIDDE
jgi:hypothetical protein